VLERIWNGWRADYVVHGQGAQKKSDQSVFTQILNSDMSDEQCYIVHRGEKVFAIMNAFPYTSGHLLVVPYREVAELEDLSQDETSELWATVTDAVKVLKSVYKPEAMNVGINLGAAAGGSIAQHLHVHIVGRWG
jgi:ATP adenylyltransferase